MSWDISLVQKVIVADVGNYTWNVSPMYQEALGMALSELNSCVAEDMIPVLAKGLADMTNNPKKYRAMNPKNGWGDYEGAVKFLGSLLSACIQNPNSYIEVC
jgi:hypothetical protein